MRSASCGAVAGVLLVALTHLASRAWREPWAELEEPPAPVREPVPDAEPMRTVADLVATTPSPTPEPVTTEWSHETAVAWAARENAGAKRVMAHTGLSEYKAKKVAADAKAARALRVAR